MHCVHQEKEEEKTNTTPIHLTLPTHCTKNFFNYLFTKEKKKRTSPICNVNSHNIVIKCIKICNSDLCHNVKIVTLFRTKAQKEYEYMCTMRKAHRRKIEIENSFCQHLIG